MEDGEVEHLSRLSLVFLSPGGSNLEVTGTFGPSPCLCCRGLCDAVRDAGCRSLCSTCCTRRRTPSPTADTVLFPSARGLLDSGPSVRTAAAPEEAAFVHRGCGSGNHQGSGT